MLTYIKLKNYRSFTDVTFDLCDKKNNPKPYIILYGENGAGKSNIINVFETLDNTFRSMQLKSFILELLQNRKEEVNQERLLSLNSLIDISHIILENKTIASTEPMIIEIGFQIQDKRGSYYIAFDDELVVQEKLDFQLNKNKVNLFTICDNQYKLNSNIFSKAYAAELGSSLRKFWGKHSFMSLLYYEKSETSVDYIINNTHQSLLDILRFFESISSYHTDSISHWGKVQISDSLLHNFSEGDVADTDKDQILKSEEIVRKFLTGLYKDIKDVHYDIQQTDDKIHYTLIVSKMIGGKLRDIVFSEESTGTQNLLLLLPYFLIATKPGVVAIDEIDSGIHDVLLSNLIGNLLSTNRAQIIMTTHNLFLLTEKKYRDHFYFIDIDEAGNKEIKSVHDFEHRIQQEHSIYSGYIKGWFSGLPWEDMDIDFSDLGRDLDE